MRISIFIALIMSIILAGCFKGEGQIDIYSNVQNATIYVDGDKKGMTGDGYTTIILEEGDHKIRIFKEKDKEWYYEGIQDVFVSASSSVKIKIITDEKPTEFRLEKLVKEKKEERFAGKKIERQKLAHEFGLSSYPIGIYLDKETKLMWQDNSDAKTIQKKWKDAKSYCETLTIGEYSDWHLPEYDELLSIVDYSKHNPTIKDGFKNVASDSYWSSSEHASDSFGAWFVYFKCGHTYYNSKSSEFYVRCVRGR